MQMKFEMTWSAAMPMLIALLEEADDEQKEFARAEMNRCAALLDQQLKQSKDAYILLGAVFSAFEDQSGKGDGGIITEVSRFMNEMKV